MEYKETIMNIKILGGGCANCKRLEQLTRSVVTDLGIDAEFEHVTQHEDIMAYPILATPGLVINGTVVCSGRIPTRDEVADYLKAAQA
jgi:small redox-active disulfide protein 2